MCVVCISIFIKNKYATRARAQYLRAACMVWVEREWFSFIHSKEFRCVKKAGHAEFCCLCHCQLAPNTPNRLTLSHSPACYRHWQSERKNGNNNNKVKRVYSTRCTLCRRSKFCYFSFSRYVVVVVDVVVIIVLPLYVLFSLCSPFILFYVVIARSFTLSLSLHCSCIFFGFCFLIHLLRFFAVTNKKKHRKIGRWMYVLKIKEEVNKKAKHTSQCMFITRPAK